MSATNGSGDEAARWADFVDRLGSSPGGGPALAQLDALELPRDAAVERLARLVRIAGASSPELRSQLVSMAESGGSQAGLARALLAEIALGCGKFNVAGRWLEADPTSVDAELVAAEIARLEGRLAAATGHAERALQGAAPDDEESRSRAMLELVACLTMAGRVDEAQRVLVQLEDGEDQRPAWLRARQQLRLAVLWRQVRSLPAAREGVQTALELARECGARSEQLAGLCLAAGLELDFDLHAAESLAAEAEALAGQLDRPLQRVAAQRIRSLALRYGSGEIQLGDRLMSAALETLAAHQDAALAVEIECDQLFDYRRDAPVERRRELFERLAGLERSVQNVGAYAIACLGLPKSLARLEECLVWTQACGLLEREALIHRVLAVVHTAARRWAEALEHGRAALALAETLEDRSALARSHMLLLQNKRALDRDQRAAHLEQALVNAKALGDLQVPGAALIRAARILYEERARDQARRLAEEARTHAAVVDDFLTIGLAEVLLCTFISKLDERRIHRQAAQAAFERLGADPRAIKRSIPGLLPVWVWVVVVELVLLTGLAVFIARIANL